MRLSDSKISHISNLLTDGLNKDKFLSSSKVDEARKEIKSAFIEFLKVDDEIDLVVRKKIASLANAPPEGSQEWSVLYKKYFREQEVRRGR